MSVKSDRQYCEPKKKYFKKLVKKKLIDYLVGEFEKKI